MAGLLHILGAGQWQLPTIRLAKQMGYRVLVTDMYRERPGYLIADEYECVDITNRDETLNIAKSHKINGIVCDTTDVGVPTMAFVAEKLGLPGIGLEAALNFTDKHRMRQLTASAGFATPRFFLATHVANARRAVDKIGLPAVVKPVDSQSSRGVHILRASAAVDDCVNDAFAKSASGRIIVEEFVVGTEVTVESFCCEGAVFVAGISDKTHFEHRPEVASRLTYPADLPATTLEQIEKLNEDVVRLLGLRTGVAHAEYIVSDSKVYLVEIAARGAGSLVYSHIVPYLAGCDLPRAYLQFIMGGRMECRPDHISRAASLAFFDLPSGIVREISGLEKARSIPGVQEILLEISVGDTLAMPVDDRSRPGFALIFGSTRAEVLQITNDVLRTVEVSVA